MILPSVLDKFLVNSRCAVEDQEKEFLLQILGGKRLVTTLLYRGSDHGWEYLDFHKRCDHKWPTISLFKVKDGDCIGGYTNS